MNKDKKQERLETVRKAIDKMIDPKEVSQTDALDLLEEVQADIDGQIDGLKSELEES